MHRAERLLLVSALLLVVCLGGVAIVRARGGSVVAPEKALGIIFCDGFEAGGTAAWASDGCSSTFEMPAAVSESRDEE